MRIFAIAAIALIVSSPVFAASPADPQRGAAFDEKAIEKTVPKHDEETGNVVYLPEEDTGFIQLKSMPGERPPFLDDRPVTTKPESEGE